MLNNKNIWGNIKKYHHLGEMVIFHKKLIFKFKNYFLTEVARISLTSASVSFRL